MRFSYLFLALFLFLNSCSKNEEVNEVQNFTVSQFPQKWKLVKMTGSLKNSATTGQQMSWQESYVFNTDGSFLKTRIENGDLTSSAGNYTFDEKENFFLLNHSQPSVLVGNCSSDTTEYLYLDEKNYYLLSSWWACDGPGLFYERVE